MQYMANRTYSYKKRSPSSYKDQIYSLVGLPTLPVLAFEIQEIIRQDNFSMSQLTPIIDKDPSLAMKLLKIANSAYYGLQEKVESLRQAIVVIGMKDISSLTVGFSVLKAFKSITGSGKISWKSFWEHCAATGHIAEVLNGELKLRVESVPYSVGLLHDIGKLVLYKIDSRLYIKSLEICESKQCYAHVAETEVFGINHMDAGKWIAEKWQLPEAIQMVIGYHHTPSEIPDKTFLNTTALIQLSDFASNLLGMNIISQNATDNPEEIEGWGILQSNYEHLQWYELDQFISTLGDQLEVIKDMVHIFEK